MWGATEVTLSDVIFLQALWKHFKKPSTQEKGTLAQIKVLLNCAASLDPKTNMKGCEDFLTIVLHAHVVAAAKTLAM